MRQYRLLLILFIVISSRITAQDPAGYVDVSKIILYQPIANSQIYSAYIEPSTILSEKYASLSFNKGLIHRNLIPNRYVTKKAVLKFNVCNTSDSVFAVWFFPGIYFPEIQLYKETGQGLQKISSILPKDNGEISYRYLAVPAHDSITVVAELSMLKTYLNKVNPRLIRSSYLPSFIVSFHTSNPETNLVSYIFCGLLLMMILYSLASFFQGANPEFLYYSGYAFFLGLLLFTKSLYSFHTTRIAFFQEEYLDFIMQCAGILFYMLFMKKFLATKKQHPFLNKLYNSGIGLVSTAAITYTFFHYFTNNFVTENNIETITKLVLLVIVIVFLIYGIRHWSDKLLRFLFWGNLCLFIFSLLSLAIIMIDPFARSLPGIFKSSLLYYEIGLFLELVFFLAGLNYKSRKQLITQARERERLKAENQMKEYEKEIAIFKAQQEERERISADMHDELGSGMTAIRLMSEIARNKMKENTPAEIEKISSSADEVLNKMNAIIWSMNSDNDSIGNLFSYIRSYALEYFESTPVNCKVVIPEKFEDKEISGDKRRNIFLCVKETLNNALKHSKATEIKINFGVNHKITIQIADNGVGIDLEQIRRFGNGLKNIKKRMETIGGTYHIEKNNGTSTTLTLPL